MGLEIRITGSSPLESMSTLAAAAMYCMQIPAVADAAKTMVESADNAMKPGPHPNAAAPASGAAPAPGPQPGPGMNPPSAGEAPPAPAPNAAHQSAPAVTPKQAFSSIPQNAAPRGAAGNPTMREAGQNSMMIQTSPSEQQYIPGMAPPAGNVPGPGAGPLPVSRAPGFSAAQVSKAGADLVTAYPAKRAEVNALLQQYGVQTLNELRPEQLGPFAMALRGLGANI